MTTSEYPYCAVCTHRDPIPETNLYACGHPIAREIRNGPKARVLTIATGWGPIEGKKLGVKAREAEASRRGIPVTWPFMFHPDFIDTCRGWEAEPYR